MLVESYEQTKRSPAYRELRAKYKALKRLQQELLEVLKNMNTVVAIAKSSNDVQFTEQTPISASESGANPERFASACRRAGSRRETLLSEAKGEDLSSQVNIVPLMPEDISETLDQKFANLQIHCEDEEKEEIVLPNEIASALETTLLEDEFEEMNKGDDFGEPEEEEEPEEIEVEEEETEEIEVEEEETEEIEVEEEETEEIEVEEDEVEEIEDIEVEEDEVEEETEEEEAGVYEIEIKGKRYYTTNEQDGIVYSIEGEDDVGDEIGKFVNGKLVLN